MAVSYLSVTESERIDTSDPHTFSVTINASARGVLLFMGHGTSSTDHAPATAAVTIGGKAMGKVSTATDTATEPGRVDVWFLGHDLPASGAQTLSVDLASATTDDVHFVVVQLGGDAALEIVDIKTVNENTANPSVTLAYGGRTCISVGMLYTGLATVNTDAAPNANMTSPGATSYFDIAAFGTRVDYQTTPGTSDFTYSYTSGTDDVAMIAVAVSEERPSPYRDYLLSLSPAGYWRLNEPSGCLAAFDRSTNLRHGVYAGTVTRGVAGGLVGEGDAAITPDGSTGYVTIPDDAAFSLVGGALTALATANIGPGATNSGTIVGKNAVSNYEWRIVGAWTSPSSREAYVQVYTAAGAMVAQVVDGSTSLAAGFHQVAMVADDGTDTLTMYVDGRVDGTPDTTWNAGAANGTAAVTIGQRGDATSWFNGHIDEVAIFPVALSAAQIGHAMALAVGRFTPYMTPMPQLLAR